MNFTALEEKLWRLALDKAAQEGEFRSAVIKLIESLRKRGYSPYDNGAAAGGGIDRETEERIRNTAYQAGYAEGAKKGGGFTQQMVDQMRNAAYSDGYAEGQKCGVTDQGAMMNAYAAGYKVGCADFRKSWAAKAKKTAILGTAAVYFVAALGGGVWFFMPHPKPVRVMRAELVALPRKPDAKAAKHHRGAASISGKNKNS